MNFEQAGSDAGMTFAVGTFWIAAAYMPSTPAAPMAAAKRHRAAAATFAFVNRGLH